MRPPQQVLRRLLVRRVAHQHVREERMQTELPLWSFRQRRVQDIGLQRYTLLGDVLVRIAQRLDVDRRAIERRRDGLRQERAVVAGVVPRQAALVAGILVEGRHELDGVDRVLAVDRHRLLVGFHLLAAERPQQRIDERRRIAERMADSLAKRTALCLQLLAGGVGGVPRLGKFRDPDLFEPGLAVRVHGTDDSPRHRVEFLAVAGNGARVFVEPAFLARDLLGEIAEVDHALRVEGRLVVKDHNEIGTTSRLNRRGHARLQVVTVHRLEIDLDPERLLGFGQQLLAQQLIGSRHEVVPAQPVYRRALCKRGRAASGQDAGHAAYERGTALENLSSGYCRHAFLPGDALGRSDAGLECLSDYRASVVQRVRTFSRAQHVVSTIICWCFRASRVRGKFGARQDDGFAEQALQPGHDPYRHIGTLPRSSGVAVAERVFPVLWKAWYRNAGARHCRRSQQEIKGYLWYDGHCLSSPTGRRLPYVPNRLRRTLRLRRATESD